MAINITTTLSYGFAQQCQFQCLEMSCNVPAPTHPTSRVLSCLVLFVSSRQARDVDESRYMYDQLAVLSPVMLALTAATPILKGRLVDTDVRWNTIATSVDDRTPAERGLLDDHPVSRDLCKFDGCVGFLGHDCRDTRVNFSSHVAGAELAVASCCCRPKLCSCGYVHDCTWSRECFTCRRGEAGPCRVLSFASWTWIRNSLFASWT